MGIGESASPGGQGPAAGVAAGARRAWRSLRLLAGLDVGGAPGRVRSLLARVSLFQQFVVASLVILIVGAYVIGSYVADEIEDGVVDRTSALTALYVDSFVSPHLQDLDTTGGILPSHFREIDQLLTSSALGRKIVSFKLWDREGRVIYARDRELVGQQFPVEDGLGKAMAGGIATSVSDLKDEENKLERASWDNLVETYAPVHKHDTGEVLGVMEFYQDPRELQSEIESSQRRGWLIVGASTGVMYMLLVGMVRGASNTIMRQNRSLGRLAEENAALADRVRQAAARKSETDERLLMRIAQDVHDGPAQDVSLALLRMESLYKGEAVRDNAASEEDFQLVKTALESALREMRQISAGLRLPELERLRLAEVVAKAAADHQEKTGNRVKVRTCRALPRGSLPLKIAVYRVIQEGLNNAARHGQVKEHQVSAGYEDGSLILEVTDHGAGFTDDEIKERAGLGLRGMWERVEMLGGTLDVDSRAGSGTIVRAVIPLEGKGR